MKPEIIIYTCVAITGLTLLIMLAGGVACHA
jgi:hypothetical protein